MQCQAVVIGGNGFSPFYFFALIATVMGLAGGKQNSGNSQAATRRIIVALAIYLPFTGLAFPVIFAGMEVLLPREGLDVQIASPGALAPSITNISQTFLLFCGLGVLNFMLRMKTIDSRVIRLSFFFGLALNFWALLALRLSIWWPRDFLNFSTKAPIDAGQYLGIQRLSGTFPEPSYLAVYSLAALVYSAASVTFSSGENLRSRALHLINSFMSVALLIASLSGTAIMGTVLSLIVIALFWQIWARKNWKKTSTSMAILLSASIPTIAWTVLQNAASLQNLVESKVLSDSFATRTTADAISMKIFAETFGLGTGLGSSRSSSFLATQLSTIGIVGLGLILCLVLAALASSRTGPMGLSVSFVLLALVTSKSVSEPDLSQPLLWFFIGTGLVLADNSVLVRLPYEYSLDQTGTQKESKTK